jgi:hypothetical protein
VTDGTDTNAVGPARAMLTACPTSSCCSLWSSWSGS